MKKADLALVLVFCLVIVVSFNLWTIGWQLEHVTEDLDKIVGAQRAP